MKQEELLYIGSSLIEALALKHYNTDVLQMQIWIATLGSSEAAHRFSAVSLWARAVCEG